MKKLIVIKQLILIAIFSTILGCSTKENIIEPEILDSQNTITNFRLTVDGTTYDGAINESSKTITFDFRGANISSLVPEIEYSEKASILPSPDIAQDFSQTVDYTVYAENGDTQIYRVIVNNEPLSTEKAIITFDVTINGNSYGSTIDEDAKEILITANEPDLSAVTTTIVISERATINPNTGGTSVDLSSPLNYTVTAEDGSSVEYTVIINKPIITGVGGGIYSSDPLYFYIKADFNINGQYLDANNPSVEFFLSNGGTEYAIVLDEVLEYQNGGVPNFHIKTSVPENIPTGVYHLFYRKGSYTYEHDIDFDIKAEGAPKVTSTNQTSYNFNDIMIINGENLTSSIIIPSNGSLFVINNQASIYNYTLSADKSIIQLTLARFDLFPSYYANPSEVKSILLIDSDGRVAESFDVTFN